MAELLPESWLAAESSDTEVSGHAKVVSILFHVSAMIVVSLVAHAGARF